MFQNTEAKTHKTISKQAHNKPSKPLSKPLYQKIDTNLGKTHIACSTTWLNLKGYRKMEE